MAADEKWEARWKKLKAILKEDVAFCKKNIKANKENHLAYGWKMAETTARAFLDEMARLEKEGE